MKRNLITGIAMMVAAFFIGTEIAQAADISFSGKIRTRYENTTAQEWDVGDDPRDWTATQVRLNAKANINDSTSAFVQMQSSRTWGVANAAYTASDGDSSVGLHQAYFTVKNLAGTGLNAKVGRQEIVLDGHRLFGHTGWTTGAQTHDGAVLSHAHNNGSMRYIYSAAQEHTSTAGQAENDIEIHALHSNFQGVLGGSLSTYLVMMDDDCGAASTAACAGATNKWFTIGARQAGKMFGLDYRAEYYFQTGAAALAGAQMPYTTLVTTPGTLTTFDPTAGFGGEASRNAYMYGVRVGKSFNNVTWKPKITLWYDYLSGTDDENIEDGDWGAFDTLNDTGHKFYGFMDLFLPQTGANTDFLGLQDIAVKIVLKPAAKWTLKADVHNFHTAHSLGANPDVAHIRGFCSNVSVGITSSETGGQACRGGGSELGTELDLTLVHKYNPNVKLVFGYSQFMAEALYHRIRGTSATVGYENQARWMYVMADVKF